MLRTVMPGAERKSAICGLGLEVGWVTRVFWHIISNGLGDSKAVVAHQHLANGDAWGGSKFTVLFLGWKKVLIGKRVYQEILESNKQGRTDTEVFRGSVLPHADARIDMVLP
jgi:hypothetical protein